ncbi:conserved oligomeric Golgi complex subunit 5 [Ditylenchus destructor]|uniref:Conserved oligomeric Golgi complex subunit 5 n=1 Tax=Ditylenchus destructor TaxID=166010 RepID=A0AAD4N4J3_9BILA|nr:conserved oligomeric Golgi complex subunit 5 [Ditylenchus destructor]
MASTSRQLMERVEDYIWGRIEEEEYLNSVVADDHLDSEHLLAKVEGIQSKLNVQLRQGVEENCPRLLEQVSAIKLLDAKQSQFDEEMQSVSKRADQLAHMFRDFESQLCTDVLTIENLTKLNRLLSDGVRCDELVKSWHEEKHDIVRQAEIINELNTILKTNDKLKQVNWINERALFKLPELAAKTKQSVIEQLKSALKTLNCSSAATCLKALAQLLDSNAFQKELNAIMDEAIKDLDALFLQLSSQPNAEKGSRLLPQLGNRLHSLLEQFQLLGLENVQMFARHIGKVIVSRVPANAPYSMRLVQTVYKCLVTHNDSVSKPIRDALNPLKTSILSQSLSNLFKLVDEAFVQDEKKEVQSVNWDAELQKEMEGNIAKTLKYISVKVEQQLQLNDETLRLSGRVSRQQSANYQMLSIAHEFTKHWPSLSAPLVSIIEPSINALLDTMKSTVSLVLASMHDEKMQTRLGSSASSSFYMKELCDHLKVFRAHVSQIQPLVESLEALPNFLNFVIEQFLLHVSLIRPLMEESSVERICKDLEYLCRIGLQPFNCKSSKLLNSHSQIVDLLRRAPSKLDLNLDTTTYSNGQSSVPSWLYVHLWINASGEDIFLPHESAGWTMSEYIEWFNTSSETERLKFFRNLMASYNQSVIEKGATEYVVYYPFISTFLGDAA